MGTPLLQLRGLTKTFGPKVANDAVDLDIQPGRVHAIVGENGAGKTTLMSMINGTAVPDRGTITFDGQVVSITTPQQAAALGIGMVFQHFKLVGSLTVAANVFLGRELTRGRQLDTQQMEAEVRRLSDRFGLEVDPTEETRSLSVGELQRVEVLKALSHDTRLLILDEPTAVLTPQETDDLFVVVRELAQQGVAVIFISHKLDEVLAIADEVTVIRDGAVIATVPAAGLTKEQIATMMVGREVLLRIAHTPSHPGDEVLAVRDLTVVDERGVTALSKVSLSVRAGEIVGVAGVDGNGQAELCEAVAGLQHVDAGQVLLKGSDVTRASVRARREQGLAYIPDDRQEVGTAPRLPVAENLIATHLAPPVARAGWLHRAAVSNLAQALITKFDIRGASPTTPVGSLSGGNMQKVVIAREFEADPSVLVVSQPTRGVDVGAMEFVHNALVAARDRGAGILLISADLNEVMSLSDRLLVIHRGRIVDEFTQETMSETAVGLAMGGEAVDEVAIKAAETAHAEKAELVSTDLDLPASTEKLVAEVAAPDSEEVTTVDAAPVDLESVKGRQASELSGADRSRTVLRSVFTSAVQPLVAIGGALLVGAVIMLLMGKNPVVAYQALFGSALVTPYGMGGLIAHSVQLLILAAAVIVSFKAGFFNIGGEGQLYVGSLAGALAGVALKGSGLPGVVQILIILAVGFVAGALWGLVPGSLLAVWNVDIIVTTLMMSSIAVLLTQYLVTGPLRDPQYGSVGSKKIGTEAMLPYWEPTYSLTPDIVIALAVTVVMALVLTRSTWGLKVRQLGEMNRFGEYTGVSPKSMAMQVMALSGAVTGLAGALFVIGPSSQGRFLQAFSPGYGFTAITVALLARLNPWAAIVAALFYADMMAGADQMQSSAEVPKSLVDLIRGLIILMITATFGWNWRKRARAEAAAGSADTATGGSSTAAEPTARTEGVR
ncbi:MAG: ATP-binding cassette domain-containing protein [Actinomycetia bacterium]|nr:ATP-binding cassette domain-containing protein [Actinomycetes bacterium]